MKHQKRNNIIIATTLIVCMVICILWATVFFVRRAIEAADSSEDVSVESSFESSEEVDVLPDALEALFACNDRVLQAASFSSVTNGFCDTQVMLFTYRHELLGERIVNGDEMYCSDIGLGSHIRYSVSAYNKGNVFLVRLGELGSDREVTWNATPISLSKNAYADALGSVPRDLSQYRLDRESVRSAKLKTFSQDTYTFVYELDPILASQEYAMKLMQLGALEELPVFDSVKMTVVMDHDFYPISVTYEESYSVNLSLIGETTCKAEYTEKFDAFEESVSIPDRAYFLGYLTLTARDKCPALSAGYQLLLSFFEDLTVYELTFSMPSVEIPMELYTDTIHGALFLHSELFDFLYQNERYHFSHGDIHVFTEAEALNEQFASIFSDGSSSSRAKGDATTDPFAGADIKNENGMLQISFADAGSTVFLSIDTASMSLSSAEFILDLSGNNCEIRLTKTDRKTVLPDSLIYEDITESVTAVSFLTTLLDGQDLSYTLQTSGALNYQADVIVSADQYFAFSAQSTSDDQPIDLYFSNQELYAVWNDISVYGSLKDFGYMISSFSGNGDIATVSETKSLHLVSLSHSDDQITFVFEGETSFSVTLTSESLTLLLDGTEITLHYRGISDLPPHAVPTTANLLTASSLGSFLQDSIYITLSGEGSIGANLSLEFADQAFDGDLLLNLSDSPAVRIDTFLFDAVTSIVYQNDTIYLSNSILNAFVDIDRLDSVLKRLSPFAEDISAVSANKKSSERLHVACDGNQLTILYNGMSIVLQKQSIVISDDRFIISASDLCQLPQVVSIAHPAKNNCVDLDLLSQRISPLIGQSAFSFEGEFVGDDFSASIPRIDFCLDESSRISLAAIDLSLNNDTYLHHIVYDGEAFYLENKDVKLFCLAEPLLSYITTSDSVQPIAYAMRDQSPDFDMLRSISYKDDILKLEFDSFGLSISLSEQGLDSIELIMDSACLSLHTKEFSPVALPELDGYADVTSCIDLLPILANTVEAGNFDFEGNFDLEVSTWRLKGIALDGSIDFSDDVLKGYISVDIPYLYGFTSGNVPLKNGNRLLKSCKIKSELFILDDCIYICRNVYTTYGYAQPTNITYTEKRYLTVQELIQSPETMLAFVLHLDPDLQFHTNAGALRTSRGASGGSLLTRLVKSDEKYMLELNPDRLSSAENFALYAETNEQFISKVGIETTVAMLKIDLFCNLTEHGHAKLTFGETDFAEYISLQD